MILQVINVGDGFAEIVSPPTSGLRAALKLIAGAYFKAAHRSRMEVRRGAARMHRGRWPGSQTVTRHEGGRCAYVLFPFRTLFGAHRTSK